MGCLNLGHREENGVGDDDRRAVKDGGVGHEQNE
jgi:hypothetical protein